MFPFVAILALSLSMWFGFRVGRSQNWANIFITIPPPPPANLIYGGHNLSNGTSATPTPTPHPAINFGLFFEVPAAEKAPSESPFKPIEGGRALAAWTPANGPQYQVDWILMFWVTVLVISFVAVIVGLLRYHSEVKRYSTHRASLKRPYQPSKPTADGRTNSDIPFHWFKQYCDVHAILKALETQNLFLATQNAEQRAKIADIDNKTLWASFHAKVIANKLSVELASQKKRADETEKRFEEYRNEYNLAAAMLPCSNANKDFEAKLLELHQRGMEKKIIRIIRPPRALLLKVKSLEEHISLLKRRKLPDTKLKVVGGSGLFREEEPMGSDDEDWPNEVDIEAQNMEKQQELILKLKAIIKKLGSDKKNLQATAAKITQECDEARATIESIRAEKNGVLKILDNLGQEHSDKLQQLIDEKKSLEATVLEVNNGHDKARGAIKVLELENAGLRDTVDKVCQEHKEAKAFVQNVQAGYALVQEQLGSLRRDHAQKLEQLVDENTALKARLNDGQAQPGGADVKQLMAKNAALQDTLQRARDNHRSTLLGLMEAQSAELETQRAEMELLKANHESKMKKMRADIASQQEAAGRT